MFLCRRRCLKRRVCEWQMADGSIELLDVEGGGVGATFDIELGHEAADLVANGFFSGTFPCWKEPLKRAILKTLKLITLP